MIKNYWDFNPSHNRVICNEDVYVKMPLAERKKIVKHQQKNGILYLNPGISIQWNLSKVDTYGTEVFVRFKEVSALERFELKSSQI